MIFTLTDDDLHNQIYHRMISENGLIEIGVHPVMYGYRVRAGFVGSDGVEIDYCAADNLLFLDCLYSMVVTILSAREENVNAFDGMPKCSKIKPYFKDIDFMRWITESSRGNYNHIHIPNPYEFRQKQWQIILKEK